MKSYLLLALLTASGVAAQERIELLGVIDGTDRIVVRQEGASWEHLSGDLIPTQMQVNGIAWFPGDTLSLANSGETTFLTNQVNFLAAKLQVLEGRDTVVLQRERDHLTLSFADTPLGVGNYHVVISFPPSPTLLVEADIDGSDELRISYAGAEWLHKQWGFPQSVRLNGVEWNVAEQGTLLNAPPTSFLQEPVNFQNAVIVDQSGRGLLTLTPAGDGITLNFADDDLGAGHVSALIAFPPFENVPNAIVPVISGADLQAIDSAVISISTSKGLWYELQYATDLGSNQWFATGAFLFGNGNTMTFSDPRAGEGAKFYRVITRTSLQ